MQKRFNSLLTRYGFVRSALDVERATRNPDTLKLLRLRRMQLLISQEIREFVRKSAIRRASRPRLTPVFAGNRPRAQSTSFHA